MKRVTYNLHAVFVTYSSMQRFGQPFRRGDSSIKAIIEQISLNV